MCIKLVHIGKTIKSTNTNLSDFSSIVKPTNTQGDYGVILI